MMFSSSGMCIVFAAVAFYLGLDAARQRDGRKCLIAIAIGIPLAASGVALFWLGLLNPTFNFRNNQGFPADWSCLNLGKGSAQVCSRDSKPASESRN